MYMTNSKVKGCLMTVTKETTDKASPTQSCLPMTHVVLFHNFQPKVCISYFLMHPTCLLHLTLFIECPLPEVNKVYKL